MAGNYSSFGGEYSLHDQNRYANLEGIEWKIVNHLLNSKSKHAEMFWKLLKYNDLNALNQPNLTKKEKWQLISMEQGYPTNKRLFIAPFVDDAWQEQCSSVYIYVENVIPMNRSQSKVFVTVETVVHSKISVLNGNWEEDPNNPKPNPNDLDDQGDIVVAFKNRATVLLKCVLAELNGLYLDGVGQLEFSTELDGKSGANMSLFNNRSFYGHASKFVMKMAGVSDDPMVGW